MNFRPNWLLISALCLILSSIPGGPALAGQLDNDLEEALARARANRPQIERALAEVPAPHLEGMEFLIRNMPLRDLQSLTADYLLENVALAYAACERSPWNDRVSEDLFLNDILPYAVLNERREAWREQLRDTCAPLIIDATTPGEAAVILNQEIYSLLGVRYSTQRSKPDQNALEVIDEGMASCTGLSVLLISASRSVGIPARLAGVPLWADSTGNHSWVEVWDDGWHFTGAAEPHGDELDAGWFAKKASEVSGSHRLHTVYASSFAPTGLSFPLVWDERVDYVPALDVTERYTISGEPASESVTTSSSDSPGAVGWGRPSK